MSLLDDARRLAETDPLETDRGGRGECRYCSGRNYEGGYLSGSPTLPDALHKPDCPWPSMPKIIAVLEAAERLTDDAHCWAGTPGGNMPRDVEWVQVRLTAYEAVQAVLRGESR